MYQQNATSLRGYAGAGSNAVDARARFIVRTYNHLFGAIALFALIEVGLFATGIAPAIAMAMSRSWFLVLGGFMLVGWLASRTAHTATSVGAQYAALVGFVFAEALMFTPLLVIAEMNAPGALQSAALTTFVGFAALTAIAFVSKRDFSFLRTFLYWGSVVALLLIGASMLFGFSLGTLFGVAMVGFAGAAILYDTSNVLREYPTDRYVAAALQLFSSVALMFWYVLRLFMGSRDS
ncbi:MAG TPA: Bax inhibitor-1 family protein [Polyangiaceae bacterium]